MNLIDTANSYGPGVSEEIVREALFPYRDVTISTKVGLLRPDPNEPRDWPPCGRPEYLRHECEQSLRRLNREAIDIMHLHRIDSSIPLAEQVGVFDDLRREGKIKEFGLSEVSVDQLAEAMSITKVAVVQNRYNVVAKESEEIIDFAARHGIAFTAWYPLENGVLAKKSSGPIKILCEKKRCTPAQLSLAWILNRSINTVVIPGTLQFDELHENFGSLKLDLSELERLEVERMFEIINV